MKPAGQRLPFNEQGLLYTEGWKLKVSKEFNDSKYSIDSIGLKNEQSHCYQSL